MLELCDRFFTFLNRQDIRYCHWKSNEHLDAALSGKTDLDILIHTDDKEAFHAAIIAYDFKCILSQPNKQFPGLVDYLGFDATTGAFVHLHVHYRLLLGQRYIKNHHLPLESLIFDNLDRKMGVNIPCTEIELILLVVRAHLKTDLISLAKHAIKGMMGKRYTAFPRDIENELRALYRKSDPEKFARLLHESGLPLSEGWCSQFLDRLSHDKLRFYHILLGHLVILNQLRPYKRSSGIGIYFAFFRLYISSLPFVGYFRSPKRKTLIGPSKVFAIVGADGSGKSTLIRDLVKWLSWKLTVNQYYYGIPKNWITSLNSLLVRLFKKLRMASIATFVVNVFWLYVAKYRKSVSDEILKDADIGKVVLTDRFPMLDFRNMKEPMDNPRIDASRGSLAKTFRKLEESYYDGIELPDRIFVLQVDIEELRKRKTDITLEQHQLKAIAVSSVSSRHQVITINANKPYNDVLLEVKRHIWRAL